MIFSTKNTQLFLLMLFVIFVGCDEGDVPIGSDLPIELPCSITTDMVLQDNPDAPVDYVVNCVVDVSANLTIEAGTVIEFSSEAGFEITDATTAALIAQGASTSPIIMRGSTDNAGFWKGIFLRNENALNELTNVQLSGAGSSPFDGSDVMAGVRVGTVGDPGKIKIRNCVISRSGGDGIYVSEYSDVDAIIDFSSNTIQNSTAYPLNMAVTHAHALDQNSVYTSNGINKIYLHQGNLNVLLNEHIWTNPGIPFLINEDMQVGYGGDVGSFIIKEGVVMEFQNDRSLYVSSTGYLSVEGTASTPVNLVGETPLAGAWKGIYIVSSDVRNSISHAIISHGGSSSHNGSDIQSLIRLGGVGSCCSNARLMIANTTLSHTDCIFNLYDNDNVQLTETGVTKESYTNEYCD